METNILNGSLIYTPNGAAREYAAVGCNIYKGCPLQCDYCYNRKGVTCNTLGASEVMLKVGKGKDKIQSEADAVKVFTKELKKDIDYLRETGIFFSFSTDPMLPQTRDMTRECAIIAAKEGVPVKILSKIADNDYNALYFGPLPSVVRERIAFGYTLTGQDSMERNAASREYKSSNEERIIAMEKMHHLGFKTFASIEPIIYFNDSWKMIKYTYTFCDLYLIGLRSDINFKKAYAGQDYNGRELIEDVHNLIAQGRYKGKVYWKESVREHFSGYLSMYKCDGFVERDYNFFI